MPYTSEQLKKEICAIIANRCKTEGIKPNPKLNQIAQEPVKVSAKLDTWINLYPSKKDRVLAFVYSLLNKIAPLRFITVTFKESWITRLFPFKKETLYDDFAEVQQDIYKIQFGNRGAMLVDVCIKPVIPLEYIQVTLNIKDEAK